MLIVYTLTHILLCQWAFILRSIWWFSIKCSMYASNTAPSQCHNKSDCNGQPRRTAGLDQHSWYQTGLKHWLFTTTSATHDILSYSHIHAHVGKKKVPCMCVCWKGHSVATKTDSDSICSYLFRSDLLSDSESLRVMSLQHVHIGAFHAASSFCEIAAESVKTDQQWLDTDKYSQSRFKNK